MSGLALSDAGSTFVFAMFHPAEADQRRDEIARHCDDGAIYGVVARFCLFQTKRLQRIGARSLVVFTGRANCSNSSNLRR
jgi:hypothetical protein